MFNLTVVSPVAAGFAVLVGCDSTPGTQPTTSSINFAAHQTVANLVIAHGNMGALCLYSSAQTHVVIDLVGGFPVQFVGDSPSFGLTNGRILDSRQDGSSGPSSRVPAGVSEIRLPDADDGEDGYDVQTPLGPHCAR